MSQKQKAISGYHMLMLISNADRNFSGEEAKIIVDFMTENFPSRFDFDNEIDFLGTLPRSEYFNHFTRAMDVFYQASTEEERTTMIDFAVKLVKADQIISREENVLLTELLNGWAPDDIE